MSAADLIESHKAFGGHVLKYRHQSTITGTPMQFSIFLPITTTESVPILLYLAGLTCNEDTFFFKGSALEHAAKEQIALIAPDTSPRGANVEGEESGWDIGTGAGFYIDATQKPWFPAYRMHSYILNELVPLLPKLHAQLNLERMSIMGHSMGGFGALLFGLKHSQLFRSVSAFAPITHPTECPWGQKAFSNYLGNDKNQWTQYDPCELVRTEKFQRPIDILIDQGTNDQFLNNPNQLLPNHFVEACRKRKEHDQMVQLTYREQEGYDHGYFFISTFVGDHIKWHAKFLKST